MIERILFALTVAYAVGIALAVGYLLYGAQRASEHSPAHNLGRASGYLGLLVRDPRRGIVVIVATILAVVVLAAIEAVEGSSEPDNRPPVAPVQVDNLRMPSTYPFERRRAAWPPFLGHRFALGADRE